MLDGKRHGNGKCKYVSGGRYTGEWVNGKRQGKGIYLDLWDNIYSGEWVDDKRSGNGRQFWGDGPWRDFYEGEW